MKAIGRGGKGAVRLLATVSALAALAPVGALAQEELAPPPPGLKIEAVPVGDAPVVVPDQATLDAIMARAAADGETSDTIFVPLSELMGAAEIVPPSDPILSLRIENAAGEPISDGEAAIRKKTAPALGVYWIGGGNPVFFPESRVEREYDPEDAGEYKVYVRAKGYAATEFDATLPLAEEKRVVLEPGRRVEAKILGRRPPVSLAPLVYLDDPEHRRLAWTSAGSLEEREWNAFTLFDLGLAERLPSETIGFNVPDGRAFRLLFNEPGYIRAYEAGPFLPDDAADGRIEIRPPEPGSFRAELALPGGADSPAYESYRLQLVRPVEVAGENWLFQVAAASGDRGAILDLNDLAPGEYKATAYAKKKEGEWGVFREERDVSIRSGESESWVVEAVDFDPASVRGDYDVVARVKTWHGESTAGRSWELMHFAPRFGLRSLLEGVVPEDGAIRVPDLAGGEGDAGPVFALRVGQVEVSRFRLTGDSSLPAEMEFRLAPGEGDPAPNVPLLDLATGEAMDMNAFLGKYIYLDFWATWCGPCQAPMGHANAIAKKRAADWEGKAVVLGISVDTLRPVALRHVEAAEWSAMKHAWASGGTPGMGAIAPKAFAVEGIPAAFFISPEGKILWRGHPERFDLEKEIDEALGIGGEAPEPEPDGEAEPAAEAEEPSEGEAEPKAEASEDREDEKD